jgi:hypothetical protein
MPAASIPVGSASTLPAAVAAEVAADVKDETLVKGFTSGETALAYSFKIEDRKLRSNRVYDVKEAVKASLPTHTAPDGKVIRAKSTIDKANKLTVTVFYGTPTDAQREALEA